MAGKMEAQVIYHFTKEVERLEKTVAEMQKHLTQMRIDIEIMKKSGTIAVPTDIIEDQPIRRQYITKDVMVASGAGFGAVGLFELIKSLIQIFKGS